MLPFNKRQAKPIESSSHDEVESSRDLDGDRPRSVPPPSRVPRFPAPPESRPRVFQPSLSDEEMTSILPEKSVSGVAKSLPPPRAPVARDAPPSRTVSKGKGGNKKKGRPVAPPRDEDDDSRTMLRQELTPSTLLRAHEHASRAADVGHAATIPAAEEVSSFPGVELGRSRNGHDAEEHTAAMVLAPTPQSGVPAAPRSQPVTYELPSAPGVSSHGAFARRAPAFPESAPFHAHAHAHAQPAHFAAQGRRDAGPTVVTHTPEAKGRSLGWVIGVLSVALVVGVGVAFFAGQQTGQAGAEAKPSATQATPPSPAASAVTAAATAQALPPGVAPGAGGVPVAPGVAPGTVAVGASGTPGVPGAPGPLLNTGVDSPIAAALGTGPATVAPPVAPPSSAAPSSVAATAPVAATGAPVSTAPPNMSTAPAPVPVAPSASHASGHKSGPKSGGGRGAVAGGNPRPPTPPPAAPRGGGSKTDEELKAAKAAKDLADLQLKDSL